MASFDAMLAQYTSRGNEKVHGALMKCVDKNGKEIYSKISGLDSLDADALPLREDAVFKMASSTKLIASIALLQCVDNGLIGLDESLDTILPEFKDKQILEDLPQTGLTFRPSPKKITARHLLSHTSGLAYRFLDQTLIKWSRTPEGKPNESHFVTERYDVPLVFEPGTGWAYGVGLDWAGLVVRRLHNNMSLDDYLIENVWKKIGLSGPYPTFHLSGNPEYEKRLMKATVRGSDGTLKPYEFWFGNNPVDQEGGGGLCATAGDYLAVLSDLISDSPKLLKPETISLMFTPQLQPNSHATEMLVQLRPAWDPVSGPVAGDTVNHGLGGVLLLGELPETGQPKNILAWGGATNTIWFACRDGGVAGFFGTQMHPFGDLTTKELINAWRKDFWTNFKTETGNVRGD